MQNMAHVSHILSQFEHFINSFFNSFDMLGSFTSLAFVLAYFMIYNRWIEQTIKPVQLGPNSFTCVCFCIIGP